MNKAEIEKLIKELLKDNEKWVRSKWIADKIRIFDDSDKRNMYKVLASMRLNHEIDWQYVDKYARQNFLYKKTRGIK